MFIQLTYLCGKFISPSLIKSSLNLFVFESMPSVG